MNFAESTKKKMTKMEAEGYAIVVGNDWRLNRRPKWAGFDCVRIAQTNDRFHGRCVRTVWAVRPRAEV